MTFSAKHDHSSAHTGWHWSTRTITQPFLPLTESKSAVKLHLTQF